MIFEKNEIIEGKKLNNSNLKELSDILQKFSSHSEIKFLLYNGYSISHTNKDFDFNNLDLKTIKSVCMSSYSLNRKIYIFISDNKIYYKLGSNNKYLYNTLVKEFENFFANINIQNLFDVFKQESFFTKMLYEHLVPVLVTVIVIEIIPIIMGLILLR